MFENGIGFQPKNCKTGHDFEVWTQGLLTTLGFDAKLTGGNDNGVDIIAMDDNAETVFEFVDENSAIEDIVDRKERARSSALLHQMMQTGEDLEDDEARKNAYMNAACYHLFLGGVSNMPDVMKNELEELVIGR